MRILQQRDNNFDFCRTMLVAGMITAHIYIWFSFLRASWFFAFVLIGFIFLSGFSIGVLYTDRLREDPQKCIKRLTFRGIKLLALFTGLNAVIIFFLPINRIAFFQGQKPITILLSVLSGSSQGNISFDILVPIAFTSFLGWVLLVHVPDILNYLALLFFILLINYFEQTDFFNYYTTKLLITGFIGILIGKCIRNIDWKNFIDSFVSSRIKYLLFLFPFFYFYFSTYDPKFTSHLGLHLIPSIFVLLCLYIISENYSINNNKFIYYFNTKISQNILFIYLFHILLLYILKMFIKKDGGLIFCLSFSATILIIMLISCHASDYLIKVSNSYRWVYYTLLKL